MYAARMRPKKREEPLTASPCVLQSLDYLKRVRSDIGVWTD